MKPATTGQAGYTIVEVMIFLIVSSALLLSALSLFGNKIQRTEFTQAVQAFDNHVKSAANEASTGTYPNTPAFNCNASGGTPVVSSLGATGQQGTRTDCIFVGKIIAPAATCVSPLATKNCTAVDIYTVVGRRLDNATGKVTSALTGATGSKPRIITDPDLTQTIDLGFDTRITGIYQKTPIFPVLLSGLGFFQSFNGTYSNGNLASGSQNVEGWFVRSLTASPASPLTDQQMFNAVVAESLTRPAPGNTYICLKSGNGDQNASITISGTSNSVSTAVLITDPACP